MKRILVIAIVAAMGLTAVSLAAAAVSAVHAWSTSKSERMLVRDATVQLPSRERGALEQELSQALRQFNALAHAATEMGDSRASVTYDRVASEYRRALVVVDGGIDVADAECAGSGRALAVQRFRRFECLVVSDVLSIPTVELGSAPDDALPPVVQKEPRQLGPIVTWVHVRVTGPSSFTYE